MGRSAEGGASGEAGQLFRAGRTLVAGGAGGIASERGNGSGGGDPGDVCATGAGGVCASGEGSWAKRAASGAESGTEGATAVVVCAAAVVVSGADGGEPGVSHTGGDEAERKAGCGSDEAGTGAGG